MLGRLQKAIVIIGGPNIGKTTSILKALGKSGIHVSTIKRDRLLAGYAFSMGRFYAVGVVSAGDTESDINNGINYLSSVDFQISHLIVACRSNGKPKTVLDRFLAQINIEVKEIKPDLSKPFEHRTDEVSDSICKHLS